MAVLEFKIPRALINTAVNIPEPRFAVDLGFGVCGMSFLVRRVGSGEWKSPAGCAPALRVLIRGSGALWPLR